MKEKIAQLRDKLLQMGVSRDKGIGIVAPLKTIQQMNLMLDWLEKNPQATVYEMTRKSLEISKMK